MKFNTNKIYKARFQLDNGFSIERVKILCTKDNEVLIECQDLYDASDEEAANLVNRWVTVDHIVK